MDLRVEVSIVAAILSFALGASVLVREKRNRTHWLFALFATTIGAWHLLAFLAMFVDDLRVSRLRMAFGVLVPLSALQFFRAFGEEDKGGMKWLGRISLVLSVPLFVSIAIAPYRHPLLTSTIVAYVVIFFAGALAGLYQRSLAARSRFEAARLRYLALVGGLAAFFTLLDYAPDLGLDIPPIGTVLTLVFLYALSQSVVRRRLIDLYELAGRLGVLSVFSVMLAALVWLLDRLTGERFFLHIVVAGIALLVLYDPVRGKVGDFIAQFFFFERHDFERNIGELRRELATILETENLTRSVLAGLERTGRVTHASVYLAEADGRGFHLAGCLGPEPAARIDQVPARPLLDRLAREGHVVLETIERELEERRLAGEDREAETLYEVEQTMDALHASTCLAIRGQDGDLYGLLAVRDERVRDAFSPAEVQVLAGLAANAADAVENSRLYQRLKERDRLAALGEMSAGLAHEIRNPLGAIKASAQYLTEPGHAIDGETREFLDIIVEEVERMNRVVSSFLDYARPSHGDAPPTDLNAAVQRTLHLLTPECAAAGAKLTVTLAEHLPPVRIDVEQVRQVLMNLVQNAVHAVGQGGTVEVQTRLREPSGAGASATTTASGLVYRVPWVELCVRDNGPGIPDDVRRNLFVPFVTTKQRGTGLGLAISQRIVNAAGGHIDLRTSPETGTVFIVRLPAASPAPASADAPVGATGAAPSEPRAEAAPASREAAERASGVTTSR